MCRANDSDRGLQVAQNGRDQFRDGRVDRHRPLQDRIGRSSIHHVQNAVDRLVTAYPQNGGPKDLPKQVLTG